MKKKILVTGAAGFIGSHVCEALLCRGDAVLGLDNLKDFADPLRKQTNLALVEKTAERMGNWKFVSADIRERSAISELLKQHRIDVIIHLAGISGMTMSKRVPHTFFDVNLTGTLNVLDAARSYQVPHVVFGSSAAVYGNTKQIPFVETDSCVQPIAAYPASKRAAEMLGFTHHQLYNTSFTALRLFTVYGPRTRPDTMAYKLANSIAHQTELPLHNDGKMFRDWIYVSDAADAILAAVDHPMGFEIINVGSGEPVLLSEFIRSMEEIAGAKAVTTTEGMPHSDMRVTFANTSKAKALLGFEPKVKLQHGIACFLSWYQSEVLERSHKPIPAPKKTNGFDVFDFGNGEALSLDGAGELEVIL